MKEILCRIETFSTRYGAWLFYAALILMMISRLWIYELYSIPDCILAATKHCVTLAQALCFLRLLLLLQRHPKFAILSILSLFFLRYCVHYSHDKQLFWSAMLVCASRDADHKTIIRIFGCLFSLFLMLGIGFYLAGLSADIIKHRGYLIGHSWGFNNPNMLAYILFTLTMLALLSFDIRSLRLVFAICSAVAVLCAVFTLCTTCVIVLILLPFLYHVLKRRQIPAVAIASLPLILCLCSILLAWYYGPSEGDTTFESRFSIPAAIYQRYGVSLLGQDCQLISLRESLQSGLDSVWIDNMYFNLILIHGIVPALMAFAFFSFLLYRISQHKDALWLAISICILLTSMSEILPISHLTDFCLFLAF